MRRLEIDWGRAEEIFRRAEDGFELSRAAGDRVRAAKRRLEDARRNLELAEASGVEAHARADRDQPYLAGAAAISLAEREAEEAEAGLAAANERYRSAHAEAGHFGGLRASIVSHIATLPRAAIPVHRRQEA